ncbi:putative Dol-P-Glc:Glc(2)Man(9)GlcNAc(2)-PP-Dol alpha-1,2-glucosyltransferase [Uloborus diversus]|uniref:putative Dol-P-Glc:Glc(2)Man(9)GlcNAc(2)-PP-Dol alpha-1,2-glucosyltransferase n=1 Tax=Uloborus diversus TaxID=327109 RepID=UPI00240A506B|nr:putative Dol-P-Glc:Glc(2)Man(9)GlcNAc(2)-PP-Dol alpha-1,2-glucosyltransferase [Uloborus diversus]
MLVKFSYLYFAYTLVIFYIVNSVVTVTYMDEIFHVPQALKYYNGIFYEWDPKITTPPGLYFITNAALLPLSLLTGFDFNKVEYFRLTNVFFTVGIFYLVYKILRIQQKEVEVRITMLSALNISMFPVLYFFTFLYYTDCGSTYFVLLMYYWHMKNSYLSASAAGAVSICFRQTNIVWVFYVAAEESLHYLTIFCKDALAKKEKQMQVLTFRELTKECRPIWRNNWKEFFKKMFEINCGYIPVAIGFVAFVLHNGSVALGDKAAHQVCINVPQIFYFLLFVLCFACPYLISLNQIKEFVNFVLSRKLYISAVFLFCAYCIINLTHVHPYLLADNRHFTFYIWRKILGKNSVVSILLIPLYIYSSWSIIFVISHKKNLFKIILLFCFIMSIVPQKLLEFRYFIIPYIMLRIHIRAENKWQPYIEFLLYSSINFIVLYLFLFKTFTWDNSEETQRFMW